jgi:hypothetical protein
MIYAANGAESATWQAKDVIEIATRPWFENMIVPWFGFRGTEEEYETALSTWKANDEASLAVVEALALKLYWLIEQNVPTTRTNLLGTDGDIRYRQAARNALADIVRDTRIIYDWRQYKIDWQQYRIRWQEKNGIEIRVSDFLQFGLSYEERKRARLNWERRMLKNAHPATREALAWLKAASALQKLVDPQKKNRMVRDYPEIDLPEFELAPSWMYLSAAK